VYLSLSDSNLTFLIDYFWVRERERERKASRRPAEATFLGRAGRFAAGSWAASLFVFFSIKSWSIKILLIARRLVQVSCLPETRHGPSTPPAKTEARRVEHTQLVRFVSLADRRPWLWPVPDHTYYLPFDSIHSLPRGRVFPHILGVPRAISFSSG
jgi:hypothetical protein